MIPEKCRYCGAVLPKADLNNYVICPNCGFRYIIMPEFGKETTERFPEIVTPAPKVRSKFRIKVASGLSVLYVSLGTLFGVTTLAFGLWLAFVLWLPLNVVVPLGIAPLGLIDYLRFQGGLLYPVLAVVLSGSASFSLTASRLKAVKLGISTKNVIRMIAVVTMFGLMIVGGVLIPAVMSISATQTAEYNQFNNQPCNYYIFPDTATPVNYYGQNCATGAIDYGSPTNAGGATGTSASTVIADAISAAAPASTTGKARIVFSGSFTITSSIAPKSNEILDLSQAYVTIGNSANIDLLTNFNYPSKGGSSNVWIIGGIFDGNMAQQTSKGSIVFYGNDNVNVFQTTAQNMKGTAFLFESATNSTVDSVKVNNAGVDGVTFYNGSSHDSVVNSKIKGVSHGILFLGSEATGQTASTYLQAIGNSITGTTSQAVYIQNGVSDSVVEATTIADASLAGHGIELSAGSNLGGNNQRDLILNDIITVKSASGGECVHVGDDGAGTKNVGITIKGNTCNGNSGVSVQGTSDKVSVLFNQLENAGTPISTGASITNFIDGGNTGYNPVAASSVTAGASVWTYTNTDGYDEVMQLSTAGGISAETCNGVSGWSITVGTSSCTIPPSGTMVVTWATTAPVYTKVPLFA